MAKRALGLTLPVRLGATGYFATTTDVMEQVRTNLTNLLLTQRGERPFQPNFGCDLPVVMFNNIGDDGTAEIQAIIETATQTWMPFVRIDGVKITRTKKDNNMLLAVAFTLLTTNTSDSITLEF